MYPKYMVCGMVNNGSRKTQVRALPVMLAAAFPIILNGFLVCSSIAGTSFIVAKKLARLKLFLFQMASGSKFIPSKRRSIFSAIPVSIESV